MWNISVAEKLFNTSEFKTSDVTCQGEIPIDGPASISM